MTSLIRGNRNLIKIDIDSKRCPRLPGLLAKLKRAGYMPRWYSQCKSPSGNGWHLTFKLAPVPQRAEEVVAIQVMLGSDPFREACNLYRARMLPHVSSYWRDRWNVLYARSDVFDVRRCPDSWYGDSRWTTVEKG